MDWELQDAPAPAAGSMGYGYKWFMERGKP